MVYLITVLVCNEPVDPVTVMVKIVEAEVISHNRKDQQRTAYSQG